MITHKLTHKYIHEPPALHEAIAGVEHSQSKGDDLTIDFAAVEFIASPFIGVLAKVASGQRRIGKKLVFANVCQIVKDILKLSGIDKVAEIN